MLFVLSILAIVTTLQDLIKYNILLLQIDAFIIICLLLGSYLLKRYYKGEKDEY